MALLIKYLNHQLCMAQNVTKAICNEVYSIKKLKREVEIHACVMRTGGDL